MKKLTLSGKSMRVAVTGKLIIVEWRKEADERSDNLVKTGSQNHDYYIHIRIGCCNGNRIGLPLLKNSYEPSNVATYSRSPAVFCIWL